MARKEVLMFRTVRLHSPRSARIAKLRLRSGRAIGAAGLIMILADCAGDAGSRHQSQRSGFISGLRTANASRFRA
jgi:hypothetical protein